MGHWCWGSLASTASGLRLVPIEMQDFAEGTSAVLPNHSWWPSLPQSDVEVVSDTVSSVLSFSNALIFQKPDPGVSPAYESRALLSVLPSQSSLVDPYDLLAGVNNTPAANKVLSKEEVLEREPGTQGRPGRRRCLS